MQAVDQTQTGGPDEPRLDKETLRTFRIYADYPDGPDDPRDADSLGDIYTHLSLWAVHGEEREVEYPVVSLVCDAETTGTRYCSADPAFAASEDYEVPEDFYSWLAGQAARVAEEGVTALDDMTVFTPEDWQPGVSWLARELLVMLGSGTDEGGDPVVPFEAEWALQRGIEEIEAKLEAQTVAEAVSDDG